MVGLNGAVEASLGGLKKPPGDLAKRLTFASITGLCDPGCPTLDFVLPICKSGL